MAHRVALSRLTYLVLPSCSPGDHVGTPFYSPRRFFVAPAFPGHVFISSLFGKSNLISGLFAKFRYPYVYQNEGFQTLF